MIIIRILFLIILISPIILSLFPNLSCPYWLGIFFTILWIGIFPIALLRDKGDILDAVESWISLEKIRVRVFFPLLIGLIITIWFVILAMFINVLLITNLGEPWSPPSPISIYRENVELLISTLIGVATLTGLIITIAEIVKTRSPHPMDFESALRESRKLIIEARNKKEEIKIISFYPCIGAVNQEEYQDEYDKFLNCVHERNKNNPKIEWITLPVGNESSCKCSVGNRPKNSVECIKCFSEEYYKNNEKQNKFDKAYRENSETIYNFKNQGIQVDHKARYVVPDYHIIITGKGNTLHNGIILLPFAPPGIPFEPSKNEPPFIAIPLNKNKELIRPLNKIFEKIKDLNKDDTS